MSPAPSRSLLARAWCDLVYVVAGFPLGLAWLIVLVVLISVGVGTVVVTIGIPILMLAMLLWRWGADVERERAALVLGAPIPRPAPRAADGRSWLRRWAGLVREGRTWRDLGYMLLLGPIGIASSAIAVAAWAAVAAALAAPAVATAAPPGSLLGDLSGWALAGVALAAIPGGVIAFLITRGLAAGCAAFARILLAGDDTSELTERIETLEASRSGAVESADAQLRRIERDLHDGAQHRLAYIAMELGRARGKLASDPEGADALLADAHDESKRAMRELRDLVRGIHPSVLSDRGLDAALSGLAERAAVPVEIEGATDRRLPPAVETAAYYVVAESLTNVSRHSGATEAKVTLRRENGAVVLAIADDGHGGAARRPGSGLEGLAQRVEALDGTLDVDSPPGGPTTITARLPCAS